MIISSNYNYSYTFQRKKAEKDNKPKQEDKGTVDKLKTMHENTSAAATDLASALLMSKIDFITKLLSPQKYKSTEQNKQPHLV